MARFLQIAFVTQDNKKTAGALVGISIMLVAIQLLSGFYAYEEWSFEDFISVESYFTKSTVTVWKPNEWNNGTEKAWQEAFDITPTSIVFGVFAAIANCTGWLQEHILLDILLLLSLGLRERMSRVIRIIQDENASLDLKWEEYEKIKKASACINTTFQYFLPLSHVNSLLLLSYFLLGAYNKIRTVHLILLAAKVVKIILMYYVAAATANKVSKCTFDCS